MALMDVVDERFYLTLPGRDGPLDPSRVRLGVKVTLSNGEQRGNFVEIPLEELKRLVKVLSEVTHG